MLAIDGLGNYRTIAADTLSIWFQRASQICLIEPVNDDLKSQIDKLVTNEDANLIFNFVCDFWDDSGAALGNALKDLFIKIVSLLEKVRKERGSLKEILEKWTHRVLMFPRTSKVLYFTLEILARYIGGSYILDLQPTMPAEALALMLSNSLANPIGKALFSVYSTILKPPSSLFTSDKSIPVAEWTDIWVEITRNILLNHPESRQYILIYFLPLMFKFCPQSLQIFVTPLKERNVQKQHKDALSVLIGCLKIAQDFAIIDIYDEETSKTVLDPRMLTKLLHHFTPELRIGGLSLLVSSPKGSNPVPSYLFPILKDSVDSLLIEIDAGQRHQVHGLLRQFLLRIRGYSYSAKREANKRQQQLDYLIDHSTDEELKQDTASIEKEKNAIESLLFKIEEVKEFLTWFHQYNQLQLLPGSPYHCPFTGVSMMKLMVQSGLDDRVDAKYFEKLNVPFPFSHNLYDSKTVRLLVDAIGSNYEDIRLGATELLHMAPLPLPGLSNSTELSSLKQKVVEMISGMRGREGDSGARISELIFYLSQDEGVSYLESLVLHVESLVQKARHDLAKSVHENCIHGTYTSLRYIFAKIDFIKNHDALKQSNVLQRVIKSLFDIWEIVKDILCHDSPEGNIPEELEPIYNPDLEAKYGPATQIILSYSWRAVKESTTLLKCLLDRCPQGSLFPNDLVIKTGDLMMIQLATVKHRGAFSSVYPAYVSCCKRCKLSDDLQALPKKWLNDNLDLIQVKSQFITRRSGGLPFLITAVLTADTTANNNQLLKDTFDKLFSIAVLPVESSKEEKMDLPQVHAFNCIKTLFIETELSSYSKIFVDRALDLAITSFSNDVWALRNCAVMLFTALQNRLFGSKVDARMSAKLFFSRFKGVRSVLLSNLTLHVEYLNATDEDLSQHVETVYPVLSLLVRLEGINGYDGLDDFIPLIMDCLKSKIWKIREIAAAVLASIIPGEEVLEFTKQLFNERANISRQNELHGTLLAVYVICQKWTNILIDDSEFLSLILSKFELFLDYNPSSETALEYFRLVSVCAPSSEEFQNYGLKTISENNIPASLSSSRRVLRKEASISYLSCHSQLASFDICHELLFDSAYEVQLATIKFLDSHLEFLKTNSAISDPLQKSLWRLFETGKWDQIRGPAIRLFSKLILASSESSNANNYWDTLYRSINPDATEDILESSLETLGPLTAMRMDDKSDGCVSKWSQLIKKYSHEDEPLPTRLAAINSLIGYLRLIHAGNATVDIYFHLYFFLTDDDFDLRDIATEFVAELLNFEITTGCYAEDKLLDYICQTLPGSNNYLLSLFMEGGEFLERVQNAMTVDEVLFSIEKQNLFRNDYAIFDQFQFRLGKGEVSEELKERFTRWINSGVNAIGETIESQEKDEFLGWTSRKGDVFRVLYHLCSAIRLAEKWNVNIAKLSHFQVNLVKNNIHELLRI